MTDIEFVLEAPVHVSVSHPCATEIRKPLILWTYKDTARLLYTVSYHQIWHASSFIIFFLYLFSSASTHVFSCSSHSHLLLTSLPLTFLLASVFFKCVAPYWTPTLRKEHRLRAFENRYWREYLDLRGTKWREAGENRIMHILFGWSNQGRWIGREM